MKNDLIRRSDALKELWYPFDFTRAEIDINIKHIPAVDAVEVVRCGDCKHFSPYCEGYGFCKINGMLWEDDFFCRNGQYREDGDNDATD